MKKILAVLFTAMLLFSACSADKGSNKTELVLFHATDMHYISPQLCDYSDSFVQLLLEGDGKMTHYSDQICDAFVAEVIAAKPDAVLIGGDITFNGEQLSHKDFTQKLQLIEDAGINVIAIPGNHDVEYPFSRGYEGEFTYKADYTTEADFKEYYKNFGPDLAHTVSPDGLSYIAKLGKNVYAAAIYTPQSFMTGGILCEDETLEWLETELSKLPENARVISLTHQNIVNHYPDDAFSFKYTIYNAQQLAEILHSHGGVLNLSGHIHLQHIANTSQGLTDIATGSMTIRNCNYGIVNVTQDKISYTAKPLNVQQWAADKGVTDENLLDFDSYNRQFYFDSAYPKAMESLKGSGCSEEEKQALAAMWAEFNVHYFAGTLNEYYPQLVESEGWKIRSGKDFSDNWFFTYIDTAASGTTTETSQLYWEMPFEQ